MAASRALPSEKTGCGGDRTAWSFQGNNAGGVYESTAGETRTPVFRAVPEHPDMVFLNEALLLAGCKPCSHASYATADRLGLKRVGQVGRQWYFSRAECVRIGKTRMNSSAQMELPLTTHMISDVPVVTPTDIQLILTDMADRVVSELRIRDEKYAREFERVYSLIRNIVYKLNLSEQFMDVSIPAKYVQGVPPSVGTDKTNGEQQPPPQST
jgi:hypothetical protein